MGAEPTPTTAQALLPPTLLRGSFRGFLAGCHTQRPRVSPGLHPCPARSSSGGRSSSPGSPSPPHCFRCGGSPAQRRPWPLTPPSAGATVRFQPGLLLWPASASGSFACGPQASATFSATRCPATDSPWLRGLWAERTA